MKMQGKLSLLVILALAGCGDSGGESPTTTNEGTGQFIDSAVEGLEYQSGSIHGLTSSDGSFQVQQGSPIRFFIGGIVLGEGIPSDVMSPLDIVGGTPSVTNEQVLNIARFLQTIDTDNDSSNGITISAFARQQAEGKTIDFAVSMAEFSANGNVQVIVAELTANNDEGSQSLVSPEVAEAHLRDSLGLEPMPEPVLSFWELREACYEPVTAFITEPHANDEVSVAFIDNFSQGEANMLVTGYGLTLRSFSAYSSGRRYGLVGVPAYSVLQWIRTLETLCVVRGANPNYIVSIPFAPGTGDCSIAC